VNDAQRRDDQDSVKSVVRERELLGEASSGVNCAFSGQHERGLGWMNTFANPEGKLRMSDTILTLTIRLLTKAVGYGPRTDALNGIRSQAHERLRGGGHVFPRSKHRNVIDLEQGK
jgi:hypothetical protein